MPCRKWSDDILILLLVVQILQVCPLELSLKSRHPQGGCGRLQSWCAEKNGLLGQGFIFFCGGICGEKKLFFTSTSTVCFLKAEVQQLSHGWLLFPWDRRRCGVQWPSIIWQGKWGNIAPQGLFWQRMNGHSDDSSRARWHLLWKKLPAYVGAAWPLRSLSCLELGLDLVWISLGCQCCSRHFVLLHLFWAMYFIVFLIIFYLRVSWCQMDFYPFLHP